MTAAHLLEPDACPPANGEQAILETVEHDLLRSDVLEAAIGRVLDQLEPEATARETSRLEAEMSRLDGELRRLADVIATGGSDLSSLTAAVRERECERMSLQAGLAELAARSQLARLDRSRLGRDVRARLTDWQGLILGQPQHARQGLKKLLEGRLAFTPTADGTAVEFSGDGRLDPVLAGVIEAWNGLPKGCVSPTGFEPVFPD